MQAKERPRLLARHVVVLRTLGVQDEDACSGPCGPLTHSIDGQRFGPHIHATGAGFLLPDGLEAAFRISQASLHSGTGHVIIPVNRETVPAQAPTAASHVVHPASFPELLVLKVDSRRGSTRRTWPARSLPMMLTNDTLSHSPRIKFLRSIVDCLRAQQHIGAVELDKLEAATLGRQLRSSLIAETAQQGCNPTSKTASHQGEKPQGTPHGPRARIRPFFSGKS